MKKILSNYEYVNWDLEIASQLIEFQPSYET